MNGLGKISVFHNKTLILNRNPQPSPQIVATFFHEVMRERKKTLSFLFCVSDFVCRLNYYFPNGISNRIQKHVILVKNPWQASNWNYTYQVANVIPTQLRRRRRQQNNKCREWPEYRAKTESQGFFLPHPQMHFKKMTNILPVNRDQYSNK